MKILFSYDIRSNSGHIQNITYPEAVKYEGEHLKTPFSFEYDRFLYDEVTDRYTYTFNDITKVMTAIEKEEVLTVASSWVQELGQEGNLTERQTMVMTKEQCTIASIILGTKEEWDKNVKTYGSMKLKSAWFRPTFLYTRECYEVDVEFPSINNMTAEEIDEVFRIGMRVTDDLSNLTDDEKYKVISYDIKNGIQQHIDMKAKSLGYDDINSISKYIGYQNKYESECISLGEWTVSVWEHVEAELVKMESGTRTIPTVDEAILELPTF